MGNPPALAKVLEFQYTYVISGSNLSVDGGCVRFRLDRLITGHPAQTVIKRAAYL